MVTCLIRVANSRPLKLVTNLDRLATGYHSQVTYCTYEASGDNFTLRVVAQKLNVEFTLFHALIFLCRQMGVLTYYEIFMVLNASWTMQRQSAVMMTTMTMLPCVLYE